MAGFNMQGKSDCLLKTLAQKPHASSWVLSKHTPNVTHTAQTVTFFLTLGQGRGKEGKKKRQKVDNRSKTLDYQLLFRK